jgi:hypothetical protein
MDITGCGTSDANAEQGIYSYTSPAWKSTVDGTMLYATGHVHDGGTDVELFVNSNMMCVTKMLYGDRRPGYTSGDMDMGGMDGMDGMSKRSIEMDHKRNVKNEDTTESDDIELKYRKRDSTASVPDTGNEHISDAAVCKNFGTISKGDSLVITANYDATVHPQMVVDGKLHPIMGISLVYIGS